MDNLDLTQTGQSYFDSQISAHKRIIENGRKLMETQKETNKQLEYISFIQEHTGVIYNGRGKSAASKYIDDNKGKVPNWAYESYWAIENGY